MSTVPQVVWPWRLPIVQWAAAAAVTGAAWEALWSFATWRAGIAPEWYLAALVLGTGFGALGGRRMVRLALTALRDGGWIGPILFREDSMGQALLVSLCSGIIAIGVSNLVNLQVLLELGIVAIDAGGASLVIDSIYRAIAFRRFEVTTHLRVVLVRTMTQAWIAIEGSDAAPLISTDPVSPVRP